MTINKNLAYFENRNIMSNVDFKEIEVFYGKN